MALAADAWSPLVPRALLERALLAYALPEPTELRFLRRGYNDHYLLTAGERRFMCRVYLNDKPYLRGAHDFLSELDVLAGLRAQEVSVRAALVRRDGTLLGQVNDRHGERHVALFEFAEGHDVSGQELSGAAAHQLGVTVATLHLRADDTQLGHHRPSLDETFLIDRPVAALRRMLGQDADFLQEYGGRLKRRLAALPRHSGTFGFVHGDLHLGNVRVNDEHRCILFDFDHSGQGWRAYDLAVLRLRLDDTRWNALLEGYRTVRPWSQSDLDSVPLFVCSSKCASCGIRATGSPCGKPEHGVRRAWKKNHRPFCSNACARWRTSPRIDGRRPSTSPWCCRAPRDRRLSLVLAARAHGPAPEDLEPLLLSGGRHRVHGT